MNYFGEWLTDKLGRVLFPAGITDQNPHYSGISIKRTPIKRRPLKDGQYDEERIALFCGQTILEKISIKRTLFFAPVVSAL